jgi:hypothetical protein
MKHARASGHLKYQHTLDQLRERVDLARDLLLGTRTRDPMAGPSVARSSVS